MNEQITNIIKENFDMENMKDKMIVAQSTEGKAITLNEAMAQAKGVPGMPLQTFDLTNQIPEDERAAVVNETAVAPSVTRILDTLSSCVPEDERAEEGEAEELEGAYKLGYFNPTVGMANITGVLGDRIYARIYVAPDKVRYVEFCEQYSDGSFSSKMMVPQSSMLLAAKFNFISKNVPEQSLRNKISKFILKATEEYLGKYNGVDEALDVVEVLNVLLKVRFELPTYEDAPKELEPEQFYHQVIQAIKDRQFMSPDIHKAYYTLDDSEISLIEKDLGMRHNTLLPKLKAHGFLYLTESCRGYQTNVRFNWGNGDSTTKWMYCIYKLEYFVELMSKKK